MQRWKLLLIVMVACASSSGRTSLVRIISSPQEFRGQPVSVQGYLAPLGGRPSLMLFLTEEHSRTYDVASGIAVFDPTPDGAVARDCSNTLVVIVGTVQVVSERSRRSRSVLSFAITDVERVVRISSDTGDSGICWEASPNA